MTSCLSVSRKSSRPVAPDFAPPELRRAGHSFVSMLERLQKILSARGIASRRKAEEYITRGLVRVNGVVATLGQKADPELDRIEVDGQVLKERQEMIYVLLQKPVGVVTENVEGNR